MSTLLGMMVGSKDMGSRRLLGLVQNLLLLVLVQFQLQMQIHHVYALPNGSPMCKINSQVMAEGHQLRETPNLNLTFTAPVSEIILISIDIIITVHYMVYDNVIMLIY